jgi:hypothetical protein
MERRAKDPERQRLGRLGGLTTTARGAHVTAPGRRAWEAALAAEFGITDELDPADRKRRMDAALRVRMARLARARWDAKKKAPPAIATPGEATEDGAHGTEPRPTA